LPSGWVFTVPQPSKPMQQALEEKTPPLIAYTPLCAADGKFLRWLEVGTGHIDSDGEPHIHVDRMPFDAEKFTGYIRLVPPGTMRPEPTEAEILGE